MQAKNAADMLFCRDDKNLANTESSEVTAPTQQPIEGLPDSVATIQQDADRHLIRHFESVQSISTSTTTPSLLPVLLQSLTRTTDYKPLLELLRSALQQLPFT